jgi:hypothetical protein
METLTTGQFLSELLWTDTKVWEVIRTTDKTLTLRSTVKGATVRSDDYGSPYPVEWAEVVSDPHGYVTTVRRRKDGTYRIGRSGRAMVAAPQIDGKPVSRTDYRF